MQDVYDREFVVRVQRLPTASLSEVVSGASPHAEVKLQYQNKKDFESVAKRLKIMSDLRVSYLFLYHAAQYIIVVFPVHTYYLSFSYDIFYTGWCTQNCIQRYRQH